MNTKLIISEIEQDIEDIKSKPFDFIETKFVPSRHDAALTFERGENKIGKTITTCVLYVDIRNSVKLNQTHSVKTMGRIYTIFAKSMLKLARHHSGSVRNIIGDRVMIVFPSQSCFTNAIKCAISINYINSIINKNFTDIEFKCGVGIDYGLLNVIKVGLHRRGTEHIDNKNLVWVGNPANIASRLTDVANKTTTKVTIEVTYYPTSGNINLLRALGGGRLNTLGTNRTSPVTSTFTQEEFSSLISFENSTLKFSKGRIVSFSQKKNLVRFPSIIMTEKVYQGLKNEEPSFFSNVNTLIEKISNHNINNVNSAIYGGNVIWRFNS